MTAGSGSDISPIQVIAMHLSAVFFLNSLLLGVGLAMDAFSVSLANGLHEPNLSSRRRLLITGTFAFFQALMPMLGWLCVHTIVELFQSAAAFVPWIALILLVIIGSSMIRDGLHESDASSEPVKLSYMGLLIQGIATSIDALSTGFAISEYGLSMAFLCSLIIALVTLIICLAGLRIGQAFGTRFSGKASILGGVILIGIGLEIFIRGVFF